MGYSCTQDASNMLGLIEHNYRSADGHATITLNGTTYFFERGRENADGAITGKLMEMLPGDMCRVAGRVRITPEGVIAQFPRLTPTMKRDCQNEFYDLRARNPEVLRRWAIGCI